MKQIVIVADDLTGACDTGIQFRKRGLQTRVLVDPGSCDMLQPEAFPVYSINTDTRSASPEQARKITEELLEQLLQIGEFHYYKKVDSVLRGNIAQELEAFFTYLKPDFALIAPAFPKTGRWLLDGQLHIGGTREDPELVVDAIERITSGTTRRCGSLRLDIIRQGAEAVVQEAERLYRQGRTLIVADTWCESDLETLAEAVEMLGSRCICVGSGGLAGHLAHKLVPAAQVDELPPVCESNGGVFAVVVGSRHPVTVAQVQRLKQEIPMDTHLLPVADITEKNVGHRVEALFSEKRETSSDVVLLTTDQIYNSSENCTDLLQKNAFNRSILDGIGLAIHRLAQNSPIRGMIATGGDIASEILRRLKLNHIDLVSEPIPGIVIGRAGDPCGKGFLLATKSGGFGESDAYLKLYRYMTGR